MSQLSIFVPSTPPEPLGSEANTEPHSKKQSQAKQIASASLKVDVATVNSYSQPPAPAPAPYGLCRCGMAIAAPGLDAHYCPECGWVSHLGGGK